MKAKKIQNILFSKTSSRKRTKHHQNNDKKRKSHRKSNGSSGFRGLDGNTGARLPVAIATRL